MQRMKWLTPRFGQAVAAGLILMLPAVSPGADDLARAGWIEKAMIYPQKIVMHAKLDTGAENSSLHAEELEFVTRDDDTWVQFDVSNRDGDSVSVEAKVVRTANIKRHFGGRQSRPVVMLDLCIDGKRKPVEVNLVDRSGLNYKLLVGRNYLKDSFLVDSGATYRLSPDCSD